MKEINPDAGSSSFSFDMPSPTPPDEVVIGSAYTRSIHHVKEATPKPVTDTIDTSGGVGTSQTFVSSQTVLDQATPQQPILAVLTDAIDLLKAFSSLLESGAAIEMLTPQGARTSSETEGTSSTTPSTTGAVSDENFSLVGNTPVQGRPETQGDKPNVSTASTGAAWLKPTGSTIAMINMVAYANDTTRQETELLKLVLTMISIMWDMTLTAASLQREIGEKEAQKYYIQAAMAAVEMGTAIATVGLTGATMGVGFASKGASSVTQQILNSQVLVQIGTAVNSGAHMVGNIALGNITMDKAELEARQKEVEGRITQIKMLLDQMIQTLEQQHNLVEQFTRWIADISHQRYSTLTVEGAR